MSYNPYYYQQRYYRRRRWVPYEQWLARKMQRVRATHAASSYSTPISGYGAYRMGAPQRRYRRKASKRSVRASSGGIANTVGGSIGTAIGGFLGGPPGAALGSVLGQGAGSLFKSITGFGDYEVKKNVVLRPDEVPLFRPAKNGSMIISFREYIMDIVSASSASTFNIDSFDINPGLSNSFPWLSSLAENFDEWVPLGIVYEFKSNSADALNSTNTALGTVIMATEYNPLNSAFVNKQQMEQTLFSGSCRPSCNLLHPIECDPKQTRDLFNIRQGVVPSGGDPRLYDIGRFSIATTGMQGTSVNVGELWVTYTIQFNKPRLGDVTNAFDHYRFTTGVDTTHYFGVSPTLDANSDLGTTITDTTIVFPNSFTGNVMIQWDVQGDAGTWIDPLMTGTLGATRINCILNNTNGQIQSSYLAAQQRLKHTCYFSCVNGGTVTFSSGTLPTNTTAGDLIIVTIPTNFQ